MPCTIKFSQHAITRGIERGIDSDITRKAIDHGAKVKSEPPEHRGWDSKDTNRYMYINVVFLRKTCNRKVITVYIDG